MNQIADIAKAFVVGVVGIGMATALFMPGRQTNAVAGTVINGANKLFSTAVTGK